MTLKNDFIYVFIEYKHACIWPLQADIVGKKLNKSILRYKWIHNWMNKFGNVNFLLTAHANTSLKSQLK